LNRLRQRKHLCAACPTPIHQHECLTLVHSGRAHRASFPAALIDQPTRRKLHRTIRLPVRNHLRLAALQRVELHCVDHRILEEAAGIAELRRVGQFRAAHGHDGVENRLRAWRCVTMTLGGQFAGDVRIARAWHPRFRQAKCNRRDHKAITPF
jgi:hypothetical protein